jgi:FkbM family methyltransferase
MTRRIVIAVEAARGRRVARIGPVSLALRWSSNRLVPWAARAAFCQGIHQVNGVRMEIPQTLGLGAGGEFHMALGTYERHELAHLLRRLRPGQTFVDVGAHIGYFTLPIATRLGAQGRVIAVEPHPASAKTLRRNVALNGLESVWVIEAAASDRDGEAALVLSDASAMWSTLAVGTLSGVAGAVNVRTRSLDSILAEAGWPPLAGIKMDVEGVEAAVLRGATEVLARNPRAFVMCEVSGGNAERVQASLATLQLLEGQGYRFRLPAGRASAAPASAADLAPRLRAAEWQVHLFNVIAERPYR